MSEQTLDEKQTDSTSSVESEGTTSQASSETSASQDAKGSTTMADAMMAAFKKSTGKDSSSAEEQQEEPGVVLNKHETEEAPADETVEEKVDGKEETADQDNADQTNEQTDERLKSFQDHPDWKKLVESKNTFEAQVNQMKPLAEAHQSFAQHWQDNGITPEQVQEITKWGTLLYTDPMKFKEEFAQTWQQLQSLTGDTLPDDLKQQLDGIEDELASGAITQQRANQLKDNVKQIAKLRGEQSLRKTKGELDQRRNVEQEQRRFQTEVTTTVSSWIKSKQKTDVSFVPSKDGKTGRYELTINMVKALGMETPVKSAL